MGKINRDFLCRKLSIAPMMGYTDRHARYLMRLISRYTLMYSEMVTSAALRHGDSSFLLQYNEQEHPIALQVGGHDPYDMANAAHLAEQYGYDEVNINVGCPSNRVQAGRFGACLFMEPDTVADCVSAMRSETHLPITLKTRIGIDDQDNYEALCRFVEQVSYAGCTSFTIHARNVWLNGLSPKENREIPPLNYSRVYRLKRDYPELEIIINGGVENLIQAADHLKKVDGVMIGRAAYYDTWLLAEADARIFGAGTSDTKISRQHILEAYQNYCERELLKGTPLNHMTRHLMGLVRGLPGAREFRRVLTEGIHVNKNNSPYLIDKAWMSIRQHDDMREFIPQN